MRGRIVQENKSQPERTRSFLALWKSAYKIFATTDSILSVSLRFGFIRAHFEGAPLPLLFAHRQCSCGFPLQRERTERS